MGGRERLTCGFAALVLLALLATAGWLDPAPQGFGTHRQLGLPECSFVAIFGTRCPSCGMTTAWAHLVRGEWSAALAANSAGALLALTAAAAIPWLAAAAAQGRYWKGDLGRRVLFGMALVAVGVAGLQWAWRWRLG